MMGGWKGFVLGLLLAASAVAFAKPAHVLYHAGKGMAYPARHPAKTGRGLWTFVKAVF